MRLVKFWPNIADAAEAATGGGCYQVRINGKIEPIKIYASSSYDSSALR